MTALEYIFIVFSKKITIFWCMFIVYTSINGLIQGIASITELSFFIIFITTFSLFFASNEFTLRSVVVWKFKMADLCLHCFYIDKLPNSRYSLNNWIIVFYIDKSSPWSSLRMVSFFLSVKISKDFSKKVSRSCDGDEKRWWK